MLGLLAIVLIVSAIIWLIAQLFAAANPWVGKISLIVWVITATLMLVGVHD